MKKIMLSFALAAMAGFGVNAQTKYIARTGQATIYSHTVAEDISATNNTVTGVINSTTGDIAISVPVQSFSFEKALCRSISSRQFHGFKTVSKNQSERKNFKLIRGYFLKGWYVPTTVTGDLTIKGVTKPVTEKAHITVKDGKVAVHCKFIVKDIGSFGVGKPKGKMKNNVADDIEVNYTAAYDKGDE